MRENTSRPEEHEGELPDEVGARDEDGSHDRDGLHGREDDGLRALARTKSVRGNTSTKLTRVARMIAASAVHCVGVETAAVAGRRAEGARPRDHEGERRGEVDARDEDDLRDCDVLLGREDDGSRWPAD